MLRNWKQILTMLLGAALFAGSLPLTAHADRDEKRHRERRVERKQERKPERKEVRHQDRDRGHARHRDADREHRRDRDDDRDRRYSQRRDRDDCARRVVHHHDRVVYAPRWPVRHSGVTWGIYASNLPPDRCDYWDPYCGQRYASLYAYRSHLRHARHAHVVHVLDDRGYAVCGYRDRGGDNDSWVQVTLAGNIRF